VLVVLLPTPNRLYPNTAELYRCIVFFQLKNDPLIFTPHTRYDCSHVILSLDTMNNPIQDSTLCLDSLTIETHEKHIILYDPDNTMSRKWTREYLKNGFVDDVKKMRAEQGYDTNEKPTHKWLRNNGFAYFLQRVRQLGYRPDEWLVEQCGFEPRKKDFSCDNSETVREIKGYLTYLDEVSDRLNGTSLTSARSHIRRSMEICQKTIGTSDIFELGRGDREVCHNRAEQMMRGFKEEFDSGQTRYNYATTLRDLIARMENKGVVEHDVLTSLVDKSGWAGDSESVKIAPTTSLVKKYFDACETRTEQMVMICLAIMGWRPSDFCNPEAIEDIYLDSPQPYVEFSDKRKNGPDVVPIILCQDFIKQWVRFVQMIPDNDTALFPSQKSADGARSTQWVRNVVENIGDRVDETLRNGEKPTPMHFRNFWYTEYSTAYSEFRRDNDFAASLQGSQSDRVPAESYTDELHGSWFNTFENFARSKLKIPVAGLEPADEIGNIDLGNISGDAEFDFVETVRQSTLGGWGEAKTLLPLGALTFFVKSISTTIASTVSKWLYLKHTGLVMDPDAVHYPDMSIPRQAGLGVMIGFIVSLQLFRWYINGTLEQMLAGDLTVWLPLVIGAVYTVWLFDRELPEPADIIKTECS